MATKKTAVEVLSGNSTDISFDADDGAQNNIRKLLNHMEAGLTGAHLMRTVTIRDTAVAGTLTITLASMAAGTVLLINGVPFTSKGSAATAGNNEFDISGGTDTLDAAALAAAINASTSAGISGVVTATSAAAVVTLTSSAAGLVSNGLTVENLGVVATGTFTFTSVDNNDACAVNGVTLTAKTTVADATVEFAVGASDAATATNFAALINSTATSALITKHVRALARSNVVHLFARYGGTGGNAITTTSADADIVAGAARLAGGTVAQYEGAQASGTVTCASAAAADTVTVNGVVFTAHATDQGADQWQVSGDDTADAVSLVEAINNSATAAAADVIATNAAAVVTVKSRRGGHQGNAITLASSNGTRLAVSGARLTGGALPTVSVIAGGTQTPVGGGAKMTGGSNSTAIVCTL